MRPGKLDTTSEACRNFFRLGGITISVTSAFLWSYGEVDGRRLQTNHFDRIRDLNSSQEKSTALSVGRHADQCSHETLSYSYLYSIHKFSSFVLLKPGLGNFHTNLYLCMQGQKSDHQNANYHWSPTTKNTTSTSNTNQIISCIQDQ